MSIDYHSLKPGWVIEINGDRRIEIIDVRGSNKSIVYYDSVGYAGTLSADGMPVRFGERFALTKYGSKKGEGNRAARVKIETDMKYRIIKPES